MNNVYIITELIFNKSKKYHDHCRRFKLTISNYTESISFGSFFESTKRRNDNKHGILYVSHYEEIYNTMYKNQDSNLSPLIEVKSLWEFYHIIGYNYKLKKWYFIS